MGCIVSKDNEKTAEKRQEVPRKIWKIKKSQTAQKKVDFKLPIMTEKELLAIINKKPLRVRPSPMSTETWLRYPGLPVIRQDTKKNTEIRD